MIPQSRLEQPVHLAIGGKLTIYTAPELKDA